MSLERGAAMPVSWLNDVTLSPIGVQPHAFPELDLATYRTTTVPMRCGDLAQGDQLPSGDVDPEKTVNVPTYLRDRGGSVDSCDRHVLMERRQVHYLHSSNFGRKMTISIQTCSEECAERLAEGMNRNWDQVVRLVRETRPLKSY